MVASETLDLLQKHALEWWQAQNATTTSIPAMTTEKIEEIHHIAYHLYQDQQYERAVPFFRLLTMANPLEMKYWKGLGAALQMTKQYEQAIESYASAQLVCNDSTDPYLYIYTADCYMALKQVQNGLHALEGAKLIAEAQNDLNVLNHVTLMKERWANHKK